MQVHVPPPVFPQAPNLSCTQLAARLWPWRSTLGESPLPWLDVAQMLNFFEERGVSRAAVEACGVYSALVVPPSSSSLPHTSASTGTNTSSNGGGGGGGGGGDSVGGVDAAEGTAEGADGLGQPHRVHCAVMPFKDGDGKEVSRTYVYLEAVQVEEKRRGRTPAQLKRLSRAEGPMLGEPVPVQGEVQQGAQGGSGPLLEGTGGGLQGQGLGQQQQQQQQVPAPGDPFGSRQYSSSSLPAHNIIAKVPSNQPFVDLFVGEREKAKDLDSVTAPYKEAANDRVSGLSLMTG